MIINALHIRPVARGLMEILYPGYLQEDPDYCGPITQIAQSKTKEDESLSVYPNPTEDWLTVELEASESDEVMTLCDVQGREVMQIEVPGGQAFKSFNLTDVNPGLYVLKTTSSECIKILKK